MKTQKLSKVFKEKWITALRSGKYKKGKGNLYNGVDDTWCCIGVAANLCGMGKQTLDGYGIIENKLSLIANRSKKYPKMLHGNDGVVEKLINFNDTKNKSFNWIAKWIEKHL